MTVTHHTTKQGHGNFLGGPSGFDMPWFAQCGQDQSHECDFLSPLGPHCFSYAPRLCSQPLPLRPTGFQGAHGLALLQ